MTFSPIKKGLIHNDAYNTADTDFFVSDLTPTNIPTTFVVQVSMTSSAKFYTKVSHAGDIVGMDFNQGTVLVAYALYTFKLLVHSGDSVNFRYNATGDIIYCRVQEVQTSDSFTA